MIRHKFKAKVVHIIIHALNLVPGMNLLNIDGRVTRLSKGGAKKGAEYCKRK